MSIKTFLKSLFTDKDWDGDATKVFGFVVVVIGIIGFFLSLSEWEVMMGFGAAMISTGKFSKEG